MNRQVFDALLVVENNAIVILPRSATEAGGLEASKVFAFGKSEPRHVFGVVDAADDERLIRVAFFEGHHDLVAHARPEKGSPAFARPNLRNAHPAGAVAVLLSFAVPVELHLDAAIL